MKVLIIAEHNNAELNPASLSCVSAGLELGSQIDIIVLGSECNKLCETVSSIEGIHQVLYANNRRFINLLAEDIAQVIKNLSETYDYIIAPATSFGKNCLPRLGAIFDTQPITDVIEIKNQDTFLRPIYAGNALAIVQSLDRLKCLTIRPTAFKQAKTSTQQVPIKNIELNLSEINASVIKEELSQHDRPELAAAKIVISGGRGLQGAEQFKLLENLADRLGAAVGASRAAVDAGFVPNDYQVGQTGKVVAPDLYIAIGISGAIQHVAGIKDSKIIVAINKDPDAPIFEVADYGLVADFFEIFPAFEAGLKKLGY